MTDLSELQAQMAQALRRRHALAKDAAATAFAEAAISGNDRLSPVEQLEIYRVQFWLRHTSSLVEDFPGLGGVIGQAAWERLVEEYLVAHPPTHASLGELGKALPEFMESATWLDHHDLCVDMARLEVCYLEAFDAADVAPLDPEKLASIPAEAWESARIVVSPSLRLLSVRYPVANLRRALRKSPDAEVSIPDPAPQKLAVFRRGLELFDLAVSDGAFALLTALAEGEPLGPACVTAATLVPQQASELETRIGEWFRDWTVQTLITDVVVGS
jgi:hypothetical protein